MPGTPRRSTVRLAIALVLALSTLAGGAARAQTWAVAADRLVDGRSGEIRTDGAILIDGDRIVRVVARHAVPPEIELLDLGDATLLPGFIDAHAHPLIATDDYQVDHLRHSSAAKALRGLRVVQEMLRAGWTTLRIPGDADVAYAHLEVRDAIDRGDFVGPRIHGAGHYLSVTGGGGDINFLAPEQQLIADGLVVDGVDEVLKAVRTEIKHGSDWIKLLVTGAYMSAGDDPRQVHFSPEELAAAVSEASRRGVPVMAHAHSAEGIRQAIAAGVRSIEHGTFVDDEGIRLALEHGTYLVPTLYVGAYYLEDAADSSAQQKMIELTRRYRAERMERTAAAVAAGVRIGVGTDNVGFPPAYGMRELSLLVEAGMTPMKAIEAATRVNAELLGRAAELGTLEAGKLADLIAVPGNPLEDLALLEDVRLVVLGGRIVHRTD